MNADGVLDLLSGLAAGAACAAAILVVQRRAVVLALLFQFAATAFLLTPIPVALALAYAAVGGCVVAILAVTPESGSPASPSAQGAVPSGLAFRLVSVLLVGLAAGALGLQVLGELQAVGPGQALGAGLLFGLGLLHVGLSEEPVRVGAGLMAMLGGFQAGYAAVEPSVALHALLIGMPLLIALVVAYLSLLPPASAEERR